jgi:tRNA (cytidine/uridine-2'-O-)-methyltransferase
MTNRPQALHVALFQPEIPENTGNIGRTCAAIGAKLWIVRPTGFRLDESRLKRAGLDYWKHLDWEAVDQFSDLESRLDPQRFVLFTKHASMPYTQRSYQRGDCLVFGSETSGLPESLRTRYSDRCVRIPMAGPVRSLNLAVSVGIGLFEAYRQLDNHEL